MRVLWLNNLIMPAYAEKKGLTASNREGWVSGMFEAVRGLSLRRAVGEPVEPQGPDPEAPEYAIVFPMQGSALRQAQGPDTESEIIDGVHFYPFSEDLTRPEVYDSLLEARFKEIIEDFRPDIVHIFGTEFPHALAMERAFGRPERTLLGIQGLCSEIAKVYLDTLPECVSSSRTLRDMLKDDSLKRQQEKFKKRDENEVEAIKLAGHITGRTGFDRQVTGRINPEACYHHMNESLRSVFYDGAWQKDKADPYTIFISQGDYPLKGFHVLIKAMPRILESFPQAGITVSGADVIHKSALKISGYGRYLDRLIKERCLEDRIRMTGPLDARAMKDMFLKSSVFVCPSILENSPNSLGEAMLLGMPVIASETGGIPSMLTDGREGFLFPVGDEGALAERVIRCFSDTDEAARMGDMARERARKTHDRDANAGRLTDVYGEMLKTLSNVRK